MQRSQITTGICNFTPSWPTQLGNWPIKLATDNPTDKAFLRHDWTTNSPPLACARQHNFSKPIKRYEQLVLQSTRAIEQTRIFLEFFNHQPTSSRAFLSKIDGAIDVAMLPGTKAPAIYTMALITSPKSIIPPKNAITGTLYCETEATLELICVSHEYHNP